MIVWMFLSCDGMIKFFINRDEAFFYTREFAKRSSSYDVWEDVVRDLDRQYNNRDNDFFADWETGSVEVYRSILVITYNKITKDFQYFAKPI